jgi:hypothetical protein
MTRSLWLALSLASAVLVGRVEAQSRWRLGLAAGPYRVDDLAGTPLVPAATLAKAVGSGALAGGTLGWIRDAGFYGLDALALDLSVGLRRGAALEWAGTVGPAFLVGGDGDGTPYTAAGGHVTMSLTRWVGARFGIAVAGTGRLWFTTGNTRFSPGGQIGLVLRL